LRRTRPIPATGVIEHDRDGRSVAALARRADRPLRHKVFVEAVIRRINPFDQWGVEWGKRLAGKIDAQLAGNVAPNGGDSVPADPATAASIARLKR
jgi:hypothetical protein